MKHAELRRKLEGRPTCSVNDAAEALGIGRSLAYSQARTGEIPSWRVGKRILVLTRPLVEKLDGRASGDSSAAR